jgi:hypothetical protein
MSDIISPLSSHRIGMFDAEVCFVAPVLPSYYIAPGRRLRNSVYAAPSNGDHWGVDRAALSLPTPLDLMWPDRFPILIWGAHLREARSHLVTSLQPIAASLNCSSDASGSGWDSDFDQAFAALTNSDPHPTTIHGVMSRTRAGEVWKSGYSQFNVRLPCSIRACYGSGVAFPIPQIL